MQYELLLFLVASWLTLIFGIMDVINPAHGSFHMMGAYLAFALAPMIVAEIWRVVSVLRATGIATLIFDRNCRAVLAHTDRAVKLEKGQVVMSGASDALDGAELGQRLGV